MRSHQETPKSTKAAGTRHDTNVRAPRKDAQAFDQNAPTALLPHQISPANMPQLQRMVGNRALAEMLGRNTPAAPRPTPMIQTKLTVGPAGDAYEIEADKIAAQVVRSPIAPSTQNTPDEEQTDIQRVPTIQRIQRDAPIGMKGGALDSKVEGSLRRAQNGGSSMPNSVRKTLEPKLGADLGKVKVHTDAHAAQLNRDMGAKAFTHKNHIYYGAGESPNNLKLTAHETVHTIQQGAVAQRTEAQDGGSNIHRATEAPTVQRIFGFNMRSRIKKNAYPNIEAIVAKAEKGEATEAELQKGIAKVEKYKTAAAKMKGVDVAERMNTLTMLGDELGLALDRISMGKTNQQAKDIFLEQTRTGKLKTSLSPQYFAEGRTASMEGQKHGLDLAESAALKAYSGNDFQYINPAAANNKSWMATQAGRQGLKGTKKDQFEEGSTLAAIMMQAMAKLPVWKGDGFRGERMSPAQFAAKYEEVGDRVTAREPTEQKGEFWSVSTDRSVAEDFAKEGSRDDQTISMLYFIDVNNARDLQGFSVNGQEEEVLCPAGSTLTVTRVEKQARGAPGGPQATAWYHVYLTQT